MLCLHFHTINYYDYESSPFLFLHSHTVSEKVPLLPLGSPPTGDAPKLIGSAPPTHADREAKPSAGASSRVARPESLILDQQLVPMKLVRWCCIC